MGNIQFKDCCTSNNNIETNLDNDNDNDKYKKNKNIKMVKNKNNYKTAPGPPVFI